MARQHATPLLISDGTAVRLNALSLCGSPDAVSEAAIQQLIHEHPTCLPIAEIDPMFSGPVPICTELHTTAGPIDNFMVTPSGLPVLVECKLWRNPEMRRQVVSQILDYAKELSRWSSSDLQREASRRLGRSGNALLELVRRAGHEVDEADFNDALTANLRRGRFLLLIVGDGIREGVEAITEYLQQHANLHFAFGLVELPLYQLPDGSRIAVPRVLARTTMIRREVIALPEGHTLIESDEAASDSKGWVDPYVEDRRHFLEELLDGFILSDPEQPCPRPTPKAYLFLYMPAPASSCWISVSVRPEEVGLSLVGNKGSLGDKAVTCIAERWAEVQPLLGGDPELKKWQNDPARHWIAESISVRPFTDPEGRRLAIHWLRERINTWVSVLRPRIRTAVADLEQQEA